MSKLNLEFNLSELGTAQRAALSAFILAPLKYEEQDTFTTQDFGKVEYKLPQASGFLTPPPASETAETPEPAKRTRAKRGTATTSEAFADKERTESEVDKYSVTVSERVTQHLEVAKEAGLLAPPDITAEEPEAPEPEAAEVTLDDLRALVTPTVLDNHRAALKAKIVELGGSKLADMPVKNYGAFKTWLEGLK